MRKFFSSLDVRFFFSRFSHLVFLAALCLCFCGCWVEERRSESISRSRIGGAERKKVLQTQREKNEPVALSVEPLTLTLNKGIYGPNENLLGIIKGLNAGEEIRLVVVNGWNCVVGDTPLRAAPQRTVANSEVVRFSLRLEHSAGRRRRLVVLRSPSVLHACESGFSIAAESHFLQLSEEPLPGEDFPIWAVCRSLPPTDKHNAFREALLSSGVSGLFLKNTVTATAAETKMFELEGLLLLGEMFPSNHGLWHPLPDPIQTDETWKFGSTRIGRFNSPGVLLGWSLGDLSVAPRVPDAPLVLEKNEAWADLFRDWLQTRYGSLDALNRQWETSFATWNAVFLPSENKPVAPPKTVATSNNASFLIRDEDVDEEDDCEDEAENKARVGLTRNSAPHETNAVPVAPQDSPSPEEKNLSPLCDFMEFRHALLSQALLNVGKKTRRYDPNAGVGVLSPFSVGACFVSSPARGVETLDWCAPVAAEAEMRPVAAAARLLWRNSRPNGLTLTRLDQPTRAPTDGGRATDALRRRLWWGMLRGDSGAFLTEDALPGSPEFDENTLLRELEDDFRLLYEGLARQWRLSTPDERDTTGVYFSPNSLRLRTVLLREKRMASGDNNDEGSVNDSNDDAAALTPFSAWQTLIEDLGYPVKAVDLEMLRQGLTKTKVKVLVLPELLSLSDEEVETFRRFVKNGGILIADHSCGLYDERGKRRAAPDNSPLPPKNRVPQDSFYYGGLDMEFGVRRHVWRYPLLKENQPYDQSLRIKLRDPWNGTPFGPECSTLAAAESGLSADGAAGFGATVGFQPEGPPLAAACLSRSGGLGRFVFLNLRIADYLKLREQVAGDFRCQGFTPQRYSVLYGRPDGGEAFRVILGDLLAEAFGSPATAVLSENGAAMRGIFRVPRSLRDGAARLIGLLPDAVAFGAAARTVVVTDRDERHWYDLRKAQRLGVGRGCRTRLEPGQATLLAGLPYRVDRMKITVRRRDSRGIFDVDARLETSAEIGDVSPAARRGVPHVFFLTCYNREGHRLPRYDRVVEAPGGVWSGRLTLGINELDGDFRLLVRDALSGRFAFGWLQKEFDARTAAYAELFPTPDDGGAWRVVAPEDAFGANGSLNVEVSLNAERRVAVRRKYAAYATGFGAGQPPELRAVASEPWKIIPAAGKASTSDRPTRNQNALSFFPYATASDRSEARYFTATASLSDLLKYAGEAEHFTVLLKTKDGPEQTVKLPLNVLALPRAAETIILDGQINDAAWKTGSYLSKFRRFTDNAPAAAETYVRFRHDAKGLFVGALCHPVQTASPTTTVAIAAQQPVAKSEKESLELLFAFDGMRRTAENKDVESESGRGACAGVRVNAEGKVWIAAVADNPEIRADVLAQVARSADGSWSVEAFLPWQLLGLAEPPAEGCVLNAEIMRESESEWSARRQVKLLIANP